MEKPKRYLVPMNRIGGENLISFVFNSDDRADALHFLEEAWKQHKADPLSFKSEPALYKREDPQILGSFNVEL